MAFNPITFAKKLARTSGTVREALARVKPDSPKSATKEDLAKIITGIQF